MQNTNKTKKSSKKWLIILLVFALIFASIGTWIYLGLDKGKFDLTFYEVKNLRAQENIRIVNVSDLHLREFGEKNATLISQIKSLKPDIIAVVGDLNIQDNPDYHVAIEFLEGLVKVAPVYFSYGNHEFKEVLFNKESNIAKDIKATGVTLLDKSYVDVEIKGTLLSIGGFESGPENFHQGPEKFMKKFMKAKGYKILLCHHPECFIEKMKPYPVDLAFAGHAHGGQMVLPFVGPVYTPDQGMFPKLTEGMQTLCGSNVVINRGLGNSHALPRFYNNPEIVTVDISHI